MGRRGWNFRQKFRIPAKNRFLFSQLVKRRYLPRTCPAYLHIRGTYSITRQLPVKMNEGDGYQNKYRYTGKSPQASRADHFCHIRPVLRSFDKKKLSFYKNVTQNSTTLREKIKPTLIAPNFAVTLRVMFSDTFLTGTADTVTF